ncbi:DUF4245 domain-containing protein [Nocardia jiangxiensis]|uniref:DUF4245 domain-containing protein n=1 Tax=Nocardia jiangxiensis TaxID=282685 RepID=A0ABW6RQT8_9NOCA|nr:DUF4245 domain-containing protein [Nocardia jiangxiensis]
MPNQKPRILNDYRDLLWSLIPLLLICVVFAALAQQCSFSPGTPATGNIPHFDVKAALQDDAHTLSFPIRQPSLPEHWTANSGSRDTISGAGGGTLSTVGYITPEGTYMQLTQSDATESALADHILQTRSPSGSQKVGDQTWTVFHVQGNEPAWITDFGTVRVLIKGAGNQSAYTTLAGSVDAAQPLRS